MLTMSMGMRQSWGLFSVPITQELGISVADFMLAIAVQNLVWGATQPVVGAYADRFGSRWITVLGTLLYAAGIAVTMVATNTIMLVIGLGLMIGIAMSCTALMLAMAASARAVSVTNRT
ncbi:MAG: MFS transporter, partial [Pseudomonadota bacterium]|nr:MFS transporter [Pseudomonadota bacterium]